MEYLRGLLPEGVACMFLERAADVLFNGGVCMKVLLVSSLGELPMELLRGLLSEIIANMMLKE